MRQFERQDVGAGHRFGPPAHEWTWEVDTICALVLLVWFTGVVQFVHHLM